MRSKLSLFIALLGAGAFMAACKQPSDPSRRSAGSGSSGSASESAEGDDTTGVIIRNGLKPDLYHEEKGTLDGLMGDSLAQLPPAPRVLRPGFATILGKPGGHRLVDYAVDCAVKDDVTATPGGPPFDHKGALTTTTGWTTSLLPPAFAFPNQGPRADLHTCLATRLNPTGNEVDIWLRGQSVGRTASPAGFEVPEAYWATIGQDRAIHFWPSRVVETACMGIEPKPGERPPLPKRVCGLPGSNCNFVERKDRIACAALAHGMACLDTPGGPNKIPVIETMIRCTDWGTFYPECRIPEECLRDGTPDAHP
jgi:hypothetical protein